MQHILQHFRQIALAMVIAALASPAASHAVPGKTSAGVSYPLEKIHDDQDLASKLMSGGCWLAGLPGLPRYTGTHVHAGVDLRAQQGEMVHAVTAGTVDPESDRPHAGYGPGWTSGRVIIVRTLLPGNTPCLVVYGHTQNHMVEGGQQVRAGEALGEVGPWLAEDGGPHLHLTVRLGELPRFGWGTPALPGGPVREGAETASSEAEVLGLGYRDPLRLLTGELRREILIGVDAAEVRHEEYEAAYQSLPVKPGLPQEERFLKSERLVRCGDGWVQTFGDGSQPTGAVMLRDGAPRAYWVPELMWTLCNLNGGVGRLGFATSPLHQWGKAIAQSFEKALLVWEEDTRQARVIKR